MTCTPSPRPPWSQWLTNLMLRWAGPLPVACAMGLAAMVAALPTVTTSAGITAHPRCLTFMMESAMSTRRAISILLAGLAGLSLSTGAWAWQRHSGHFSGSHVSGGVRHFEGGRFPGPHHFHSGPRVFIGG